MFFQFIKITIRSLIKQRTYVAVNLFGLTSGFAVFFLILLFVSDEFSYDKYHKNSKEIYRLINVYEHEGVGEKSTGSPFPIMDTFMVENPGLIKKYVRFFNFSRPQALISCKQKPYIENRFFWTDSSVFDVFDYQFIEGDKNTALKLKENIGIKPIKSYDKPWDVTLGSVVITETIAKKYFLPGEKIIGQTILYDGFFKLEITGIIKDIPSQSHFKFDFLASLSTITRYIKISKSWIWNPCWTYVLLEKNVKPAQIEKKINYFVKAHFSEPHKNNISYNLQALTDIHLNSNLDYEIESNSSKINIYIITGIAIFVLFIALINFVNLSTSGTVNRAKETVIKKVLGTNRFNLIFQFISESIILVFFAIFISLLIVELCLPYFNIITEKNIILYDFMTFKHIIYIIFFGLISGIIGGIFPAWHLSSYKPVIVLSRSYRKSIKSSIPRKIMVIAQFSIAVMLISGTIIIYRQLFFLRNANLGFDKEQLVLLYVPNSPIVSEYSEFKKELLTKTGIMSISGMSHIPGVFHNTYEFTPVGFPKKSTQFFPAMNVGFDFVKTMGIKVLYGKNFEKTDSIQNTEGILINEKMAKFLGCKNIKDAVGKHLRSFESELEIIGVIKDFNLSSLHNEILPFIIQTNEGEKSSDISYVAIRISSKNTDKTIKEIEKIWNIYAQDHPFQFQFLEDKLNNLYKNEDILVRISVIFAFIATFIASLGLLGLTSFLTEQRTKEIGVRKVLGASSRNIIKMFSLEFLKLVIISNFIAAIPTYFFFEKWLQSFAYQTNVPVWIFILTAVISIIFAVVMISYQTIKAALKSPVNSLKYE